LIPIELFEVDQKTVGWFPKMKFENHQISLVMIGAQGLRVCLHRNLSGCFWGLVEHQWNLDSDFFGNADLEILVSKNRNSKKMKKILCEV
jgi:hypothetical protein